MKQLIETKVAMLQNAPFYHSFLSQCSVFYDDKIPTACISIKRTGNIQIRINKEFFTTLNFDERQGLLMHEILHLISGHLVRFNKESHLNHLILNIAQDIAINQLIESHKLPKGVQLPENYKFELNRTSEYYYNKLINKVEKYKKQIEQGTLDEHSKNEVECSDKMVEQMVKSLTYKAYTKNHGNVSHQLKQFIEEALKEEKINWKQVLRRFIGKNLSKNYESSKTRPNRRLGLLSPGQKKTYQPKILVALDQSGSISNESLGMFFNELKSILKGTEDRVDVIAFDTTTEYLGSIANIKNLTVERVLSGGTSFVPVFEDRDKYKSDMLIIFTDGYGELPTEIGKHPVLWVLNHNDKLELPGTVLHLEEIK